MLSHLRAHARPIRVFNAATNTSMHIFHEQHKDFVVSAAFSPDGTVPLSVFRRHHWHPVRVARMHARAHRCTVKTRSRWDIHAAQAPS